MREKIKLVESKRDEPVFNRAAEIALLKDQINKQYKTGALMSGDEFTNVYALRRPTGITTLDLSIGGGWPAGGLSEIIGKEGGTKSYLANRTVANVQKIYGEDAAISLCMTEMQYDKAFAKYRCGVRIAYSDQEIEIGEAALGRKYTDEEKAFLKDQIGTIQEAIFTPAEELLEVAAQQIESNLYQLILIDSIGALLTQAEAEADDGIAAKHYGGAARALTSFMHRVHAALNRRDKYGRPNTTTILCINQYRENIGAGLYGNPMKISGGYAIKHGKIVDVHIEAGRKHTIKIGSEWFIVGKEINWEIIKGKAGCHDGPKGSYAFYFGEHGYPFGVDILGDLVVAGILHGVINQAGAWYSYAGEKIGQGKENVVEYLKTKPDLVEKIQKEVFDKAGIKFITKELF